jgi:outer membrane biosynthesis protein TonB
MRLVLCVWLASLSGCLFVAKAAEPAVAMVVNHELAQSNEDQERRAQAEEAEAAEIKRVRENAAIRATGDRLRAERETPALFAAGPGPVAATTPERLDRTIIMEAIGAAKPQITACRGAVSGQVLARVDVAPDGHVIRVEIASTPDQALGRCVAAAMAQATFAVTRDGGSFRFPFMF